MTKNYLRNWQDGRDFDEPDIERIPRHNPHKLVKQERDKPDYKEKSRLKEIVRWGDVE